MQINVFAINIPDKPNSRVLDQTNTLSIQQQQILIRALDKLYNTKSHTEIQILIVPTLENEAIEEVSLKVARKWKIGQKNTNNGALFLVAIKDHKYRIEVGYGLEGVLPDGYIGRLERNIMAPYFAKNDFFNGLNSAINSLSQEISKDYKTRSQTSNKQAPTQYNALLYVLLGVGLFTAIILVAASSGNSGRLTSILWFLLKIITLAALFRGSNNRNDDDIGGGGDFGGGGGSNKW